MDHQESISETFKAEYSNLVGVLCQFYGIEHIQLAEDIVSDTFVQAMKSWSHNGVPEQRKAWLRKVAINKVKDHHRRSKIYKNKVLPNTLVENRSEDVIVFSEEMIEDSQLHMMFAICHPDIGIESQICMALRYLCGFNIDEIAIALLSNKGAINKKLYRAKQKFKTFGEDWNQVAEADYAHRLDSVIRIIYLLYNEGYYSSIVEVDIRQEICWEAMRLGLFLSNQAYLPNGKTHALIALMCFHASRFDSRIDAQGQSVLYHDQDRNLWNQELIQKGEKYLALSSETGDISKYHLEAAIAYWHTREASDKWNSILQLYNKLLTIEYSPIAAMNRTYALARANSPKEALKEAKKLDLQENHMYYSLIAELYKLENDVEGELEHLNLALKYAKRENEIHLLKTKLSTSSKKVIE